MFPTGLADLAHVVVDLPVTVDPTALNPELLDQSSLASILSGSLAQRLTAPRIVPATMHTDYPAEGTDLMLVTMSLDKGVLYPDCFAKYAAAFFRMSRSSVTRLSSFLSR